MPQTPQIETKAKTSQITAIIATVAAAIGIGALIYFAVSNNNIKVATEATLPLFEQEYQPNVEPVTTTTTDKAVIADTQAKYQTIANSVMPVVEKQAQTTGKTTAQIINETQKDILVQQVAELNIAKTSTIIQDQVIALADKGAIDSFQVQAAEELALSATYDNLTNATTSKEVVNPYVEFTSAQVKDIQIVAENVANEVTQLNTASSSEIAQKTDSNENDVNSVMTVEFNTQLNNAVESNNVVNDYEVNYAINAEATENANESGTAFSVCNTNTNNCEMTGSVFATKEQCEELYKQQGLDIICYNSPNECMANTACGQAQEAIETQYEFFYCKDGAWTSQNFVSDPGVIKPIATARENCQNSNNVEICYLENENSFQAAKDACQPQAVVIEAVDEPAPEQTNLRVICQNQACVETQIPIDAEPCANGDPIEEAKAGCYSDMASCQDSDCEPKQDYYYCEENVGCQITSSTEEACARQYGTCYPTNVAGSGESCNTSCNKQELQTFATVQQPMRPFQFCDKQQKQCVITSVYYISPEACAQAMGVEKCYEINDNVCQEEPDCKKEDPILDPIKDECDKNLPNNPYCQEEVVRIVEEQINNQQPEEPVTIEDPKLALASSIIYRGLGRVIIKFWADPNQPLYYDYTSKKLADDHENNKLRVRFSSKKENLTDILKVYKDPRNPNKYYAIAYKLNIDYLWQNKDGNYKSQKHFYQVNSDVKKSDFFDFKSLQRGGEVLYVKNRLYNGKYDLKKYGTIELNFKNKGQVADDVKKLNNKLKNFENGGVYFWTESSKASPFGLRTAMAGDQRYKQFYSILKSLQKKNDINKAVKVLYNYHDRLVPTNIYSRYDPGYKFWVKEVNNGNLSFSSMVTYVMLGTDEPRTNLQQFWGTGKQGLRKADIELSFVKSLSRGITQMSDISRFMNASKYVSTASIRADLRNSDEFRRLLKDVYKRGGASDALSLLYINILGRPIDPDGQPYFVNKFDKLRKDGLSATDAFMEIDKEITNSTEFKNALIRPIKTESNAN